MCKLCENKDFFNVDIPSEDTKSDEAPFIIYADLECLIAKTDGRENKQS